MRDIFQKQDLAAYRKAKVSTAALQKYLAHVKQRSRERGKMTLEFLEEDKSGVGNPLETPEDPSHIAEELLDNVHPL